MTVVFHELRDSPPEVIRFWREHLAGDDLSAPLSGSPEWSDLMLSGRTEISPSVAVVRDDEGQIAAVFPFSVRTPRLSRYERFLLGGSATCGVSAFSGDVIGDGDSVQVQAELWKGLNRRYPDLKTIALDRVVARRLDYLMNSASSGGFFVHHRLATLPHYYLNLQPRWEDYLALHSKRSWKRLESSERSLATDSGGEVRLIEFRAAQEWSPYREQIEAMMNSTWQAAQLGHRLSLADHESAAAYGFLRSFLLMAGDRAVAFQLAYQGHGVLLLQQTGYDATFGKYGPGAILQHRMMERLYADDKPDVVDHGIGEAEYKSKASNRKIDVCAVLLVKNQPLLRMGFGIGRVSKRGYRSFTQAVMRVPVVAQAWKRYRKSSVP